MWGGEGVAPPPTSGRAVVSVTPGIVAFIAVFLTTRDSHLPEDGRTKCWVILSRPHTCKNHQRIRGAAGREIRFEAIAEESLSNR